VLPITKLSAGGGGESRRTEIPEKKEWVLSYHSIKEALRKEKGKSKSFGLATGLGKSFLKGAVR